MFTYDALTHTQRRLRWATTSRGGRSSDLCLWRTHPPLRRALRGRPPAQAALEPLTNTLEATLKVLADQLVRPMLELVVLRAWKAVLFEFKVRRLPRFRSSSQNVLAPARCAADRDVLARHRRFPSGQLLLVPTMEEDVATGRSLGLQVLNVRSNIAISPRQVRFIAVAIDVRRCQFQPGTPWCLARTC